PGPDRAHRSAGGDRRRRRHARRPRRRPAGDDRHRYRQRSARSDGQRHACAVHDPDQRVARRLGRAGARPARGHPRPERLQRVHQPERRVVRRPSESRGEREQVRLGVDRRPDVRERRSGAAERLRMDGRGLHSRGREAHDLRTLEPGLRHIARGNLDLHGDQMRILALGIALLALGAGPAGAFDHTTPGMPTYDPDGAAQQMTSFIAAVGGTGWANVSTQYYETVNGQNVNIQNPSNILAGTWYDNTNPIHDNVSGLELAQEAQRAVAHFGVTDLANSQFVIAQPQKYNEAGFNSGAGYCAWHDYTQPQYYPGVQPGISFTNMPYVLNSGTGCGENSVNTGYFAGRLDGFTIVVGHEIEETITDPGAEDVINGQ